MLVVVVAGEGPLTESCRRALADAADPVVVIDPHDLVPLGRAEALVSALHDDHGDLGALVWIDGPDAPDTSAGVLSACLDLVAAAAPPTGARAVIVLSTPVLGDDDADRSAGRHGALVATARAAARRLGPAGTTVNVVRTVVPTAAGVMPPIGRHAAHDEVAAAVAFLSSDEAAFVTGVVLPVDGGASIGAGLLA